MADLSTLAVVTNLWRAPTAGAEEDRVTYLLAFASAVVRRKLPQIDAWIADGTVDADLVAGVVGAMVARGMRGWTTDNIRQVTIDDYSETRDTSLNDVFVTGDELALITPSESAVGAFTIVPGRSWP